MQTCPECGGRNEDGELFCGSCGTYLEWEEQESARAAQAQAEPGPAADAPADASAVAFGSVPPPAPRPTPSPAPQPAAPPPPPERRIDLAPATASEPRPAPAPQAAAVPGPSPEPTGAPSPAPPADAAPASEAVEPQPEPEAGPEAVAEPPAPAPDERTARQSSVGSSRSGGMLGSRARRMVRRTADRATGGAVSSGSAAISRTRSQASRVTRVPGVGGAAARAAAPAPTRPAATAPPAPAATTAAAPTGPLAPAAPAGSPPAPAGPAPRRPEARQPGAPVPRRREPTPAAEELPPKPGDLICGACGAGNAAPRNFCRRCGAGLADAEVQPQRSWWRRLLRPEPKRGPAAGTRPKARRRRRRFPTGLVVMLLVLGLAAGAVWYFWEPIRGGYESVVDRVAGNDPIHPPAAEASSERADRPAAQAIDGVSNRAWSPEGQGPGEWIEFELDRPRRLVTLLVTAGNGLDEEGRLAEARPERVRLTFSTSDGEQVEDITLPDSAEPTIVPVGMSDVASVRLTIQSVYGADLQAPVSVAEVEFRGRG